MPVYRFILGNRPTIPGKWDGLAMLGKGNRPTIPGKLNRPTIPGKWDGLAILGDGNRPTIPGKWEGSPTRREL